MITFTGSVAVGKEIRANAGLKRVTLELGGNAGLIIDRDADLGLALERAIPGAFFYSGQICISIQRIYVHQDIASGVHRKVHRCYGKTSRSDIRWRRDTDIASLISETEAERVVTWIDDAVQHGAKLLTGANEHERP